MNQITRAALLKLAREVAQCDGSPLQFLKEAPPVRCWTCDATNRPLYFICPNAGTREDVCGECLDALKLIVESIADSKETGWG